LNKSELIDSIAEKGDLTKPQAKAALEAFLDTVQEQLQQGNEISLIGFGAFSIKERAARTGRNPQTGKALEIVASKIPVFKAGKALKEACNS
jgi:DNA-binding protein HU-beta